jgi:hypothetical protein
MHKIKMYGGKYIQKMNADFVENVEKTKFYKKLLK